MGTPEWSCQSTVHNSLLGQLGPRGIYVGDIKSLVLGRRDGWQTFAIHFSQVFSPTRVMRSILVQRVVESLKLQLVMKSSRQARPLDLLDIRPFPRAPRSCWQGASAVHDLSLSIESIEQRFRAARCEGHHGYSPVPLLPASAWAIRFAISAFTASRLKLAPRCIGGNSMKDSSALAITFWTNTNRQNSYLNHSK